MNSISIAIEVRQTVALLGVNVARNRLNRCLTGQGWRNATASQIASAKRAIAKGERRLRTQGISWDREMTDKGRIAHHGR